MQFAADGEEVRKAVTSFMRIVLGLASGAIIALAGKIAWGRFLRWRRQDPAEVEKLRRLDINRRGRICAGRILDLVEGDTAEGKSDLVSYSYEVAGVTYEAAQDVTALPEIAAKARFLSGHTASVKYDPRQPMNSIIACEEWCGLGKDSGQ